MLNPEKISYSVLQFCLPHLSDVATLPWEIRKKSHFFNTLFIYFRSKCRIECELGWAKRTNITWLPGFPPKKRAVLGASPGPLGSMGNIRRGPKLLGRWQQRCGLSLSVLLQIVYVVHDVDAVWTTSSTIATATAAAAAAAVMMTMMMMISTEMAWWLHPATNRSVDG